MTQSVQSPPRPEGFDPLSPTFLADPHEFWQTARENPVFFYEPLGIWVLAGFEEVGAAFRDWKTFSSQTLRAIPLSPASRERVPAEIQEIPPRLMACAFINMDPPQHTVDRKKSQQAFTRPLVNATEPRIRALANELIDSFAAAGSCDLMADFCHRLTLGVILDMIGLPAETMPEFRTWVDDFFGLMTPGNAADDDAKVVHNLPDEEVEARYLRLGEAYAFFEAQLEERRAEPRDDLASAMVQAKNADDEPAMSYEHILTHLLELAAAGSETTATLIGLMVDHLSRNPQTRDEILAEPELWTNAVEEGLRRWTIASNLLRVTTTEVEIGGVTIPAGSPVLVNLPGANSDGGHFENPLEFDLHRENVGDHLAFGVGRHFCLGAPLARLEARCGLEELYRRLPDITSDPAQPLEHTVAMTVRGIKQLPVSWTPQR